MFDVKLAVFLLLSRREERLIKKMKLKNNTTVGTVPKTHLHDRLRPWSGQVKRGRVKLIWTQHLPSYLYNTVIQAFFSQMYSQIL